MRSIATRSALAALLALGAAPAPAQGLDLVNGLFEEVNAVTIYYQRGAVTADGGKLAGDDLRGAGLEVLIDLATSELVALELGLGASYLHGYASDDALDFRTSVRALPTVSLYASRKLYEGDVLTAFALYGGLSFGLVDLWNAQAYDAQGRAWDVEAQTFETGASLGAYWTTSAALGFFVETGFRRREFSSIKWTLPEDESLPEGWRSLDLSGTYLQLGLQLRVKEDDDNETITPPAPAGVWTLTRVNGAELPGALDASTQLVHAVLRLTPARVEGTGTWRLELHRRGNTVPAAPAEPEVLSGTYTTAEDGAREQVLTLTPTCPGCTGVLRAERLAGRLYVRWQDHVLVFAPGNAKDSGEDGDS
jgi:hypothetical protein